MDISEETIDTIYTNASLGHDYQLHTLTKAQVVALIDRLRKAESRVEEIKGLVNVEAARLTWPQAVSIVFDTQNILKR